MSEEGEIGLYIDSEAIKFSSSREAWILVPFVELLLLLFDSEFGEAEDEDGDKERDVDKSAAHFNGSEI